MAVLSALPRLIFIKMVVNYQLQNYYDDIVKLQPKKVPNHTCVYTILFTENYIFCILKLKLIFRVLSLPTLIVLFVNLMHEYTHSDTVTTQFFKWFNASFKSGVKTNVCGSLTKSFTSCSSFSELLDFFAVIDINALTVVAKF